MKERPIHLVLLEEELKRRKRVNSRFSLRTFAKMIGADPSHLSKILQCDKPLTPNIAKRFIEKSELSEGEKGMFWESFIREREKSFGEKNLGLEELLPQRAAANDNAALTNENFHVMSEPYHWAIVEMTKLPGFGADPEKIAQKIGHSVVEVTSAIQRLVRCGFLKKTEDGVEPVKSTWEIAQGDAITTTARTLHQKRVMEKAAIALDRVASECQAQEAMTLSIDASKMGVAQERIRNFLGVLAAELGSDANGEVYQLSMSLFPVSGTYGQLASQIVFEETVGAPVVNQYLSIGTRNTNQSVAS